MKQRDRQDAPKFPYWFEHELLDKLDISQDRFHKVGGDQWEGIYRTITDTFADKTKIWKNGLHWANINGYSPKSMEKLLGCYQVAYDSWFYQLPEIILEQDSMVYFLIDRGGDWFIGEVFWSFESYIPELIKVLDLLSQNCFLGISGSDFYIVSKKYQWIIGYNHHDIVSLLGEGISSDCFK